MQAVLFFGLLICAFLAPVSVCSGERTAARILSVQQHKQWVRSTKKKSRVPARRMAKFSEESEPVLYDQVVDVFWTPPLGGLKAGSVLRLSYIQRRSKTAMSLDIAYPFRVEKRRKAHFVLPAEVVAAAGPIQAWRVSLRVDERILAEQRSTSWRTLQ